MKETLPPAVAQRREQLRKILAPLKDKIVGVESGRQKHDAILFDWFGLDPRSRAQIVSIFAIGKPRGDAKPYFVPFGVVPQKGLVAWMADGEPASDGGRDDDEEEKDDEDEDADEDEEEEEEDDDDEDDDDDEEEEKESGFESLDDGVADRTVMTAFMNQPMHFLLYEAHSGAVHLAEIGSTEGVPFAKALTALNLKPKGSLPRTRP